MGSADGIPRCCDYVLLLTGLIFGYKEVDSDGDSRMFAGAILFLLERVFKCSRWDIYRLVVDLRSCFGAVEGSGNFVLFLCSLNQRRVYCVFLLN